VAGKDFLCGRRRRTRADERHRLDDFWKATVNLADWLKTPESKTGEKDLWSFTWVFRLRMEEAELTGIDREHRHDLPMYKFYAEDKDKGMRFAQCMKGISTGTVAQATYSQPWKTNVF
jgi:hypothetical protein